MYKLNIHTSKITNTEDTSVESIMLASQELTTGKQSLKQTLSALVRVCKGTVHMPGMDTLLKSHIEETHKAFDTLEDVEYYTENKEQYNAIIAKEEETRTDEEKELIEAFEAISFTESTDYNKYLLMPNIYSNEIQALIKINPDYLEDVLIPKIKAFNELHKLYSSAAKELNDLAMFDV